MWASVWIVRNLTVTHGKGESVKTDEFYAKVRDRGNQAQAVLIQW